MEGTAVQSGNRIAEIASRFRAEYGVSLAYSIHRDGHRIAAGNEELPMKSASLAKLFVAQAVIDSYKRSGRSLGDPVAIECQEGIVSVLSGMSAASLPVSDLLYLSLAYSDNLAYNVLLSMLEKSEEDRARLSQYPGTEIHSVGSPHPSLTTVTDVASCMSRLVSGPGYSIARDSLSRGTGTRVSLNYLPTRLKYPDYEIDRYCSKTGFLPDTVNEAIWVSSKGHEYLVVIMTSGWSHAADWYTDLNIPRASVGKLIQELYEALGDGPDQ